MRHPIAVIQVSFWLCAGTLSHSSEPQAPASRPTHPLVIVGGMMIDGTGTSPKQDQALVIRGERIEWVGPMEEVQTPEGAEVIDATGMTVMPGLINGNGYVTLRGIYPAPAAALTLEQLEARWKETWAGWEKRAWLWLMRGVTGIRNSSGPLARVRAMKQAIDRGQVPGPRIYLGGTLIFSEPHFKFWTRNTPDPKAVEWLRNDFAFTVVKDPDRDTDRLIAEDIRYWKFYLSDQPWDGKNDFSDAELKLMFDKARAHGIRVDLHSGVHMARAIPLGVHTVQHPFLRNELVEPQLIQSFVKHGVYASTCLTQMVVVPQFAADPHRFNETLYSSSLTPEEYRLLMRYRDRMLWNQRHPGEPGLQIGDPQPFAASGALSFNQQQKQRQTARENMRRFIKAGVKFFMATDSEAFLNFQQEDPDANEIRYMVELGMTPMAAILAATRNGAEALGILDQVGTLEAGKLADVIIVPGNPLADLEVLKRVFVTIKGGVRYK
jgi:imidazolonepropionase-like amidohydrolase